MMNEAVGESETANSRGPEFAIRQLNSVPPLRVR